MPNTVPTQVKPSGGFIAPLLPAIPAQRTGQAPQPTLDHLFAAPLGDLIAEFNTRLIDSEIDDPAFYGATIVRGKGQAQQITLLLPPEREEFERDFIARYLLAQALHTDLAPLPAPFETQVHPLIDGIPA